MGQNPLRQPRKIDHRQGSASAPADCPCSTPPKEKAAQRRYDPSGLFFVRHGVGSEGCSEDRFDRSG